MSGSSSIGEPLARCPRCGYDLRGTTATWADSCPLDGVCAECGLEFRWADIFDPLLDPPLWSVETAPTARRFLLNAIRTAFMSVRPWRFWRNLRMTHPPRWGRLALYVALLPVLTYVLFLACHGVVVWREWAVRADGLSLYTMTIPATPATLYHSSASPWEVLAQAVFVPWSNEPPAALKPGPPAGVSLPPGTPIQNAPRFLIRPAEVVRRTPGVGPITPSHPSSREIYRIWMHEGPWLQGYAGGRSPTPFGERGMLAGTLAVMVGFSALLAVLCPVGFLVLPASRRRAKVRLRHTVRVALYSAPVLLLPLAFGLVGAAAVHVRETGFAGYGWYFRTLGVIAFGGVPLLLLLWWGFAVDRHLRMQRPWAVAAAVLTMAYGGALALGFFRFWGPFWVWV